MTLVKLNTLKDSIENLDPCSPEKLDHLVGQMFEIFELLQDKIDSSSSLDQEEALQIAVTLKEALKRKAAAIRDETNETEEQPTTKTEE